MQCTYIQTHTYYAYRIMLVAFALRKTNSSGLYLWQITLH